MKIYRVIPDSFSTNQRLSTTELTGVEDIYYRMGYTSFLGRRGCHKYNNIYQNIKEEGKYFFLFPEDAIKEGHHLLSSCHRLSINSFLVAEYDIPEDLILKNIGYGDYTLGIMPWYIMETHIEKSDLGKEIIFSDEISKEEKIKYLMQSFSAFLKTVNEYNMSSLDDIFYYQKLFGTDHLDSIVEDEDKLKQAIVSSQFYQTFINENGILVKSPYVTGKIIPVNLRYVRNKLDGWENATEYFQKMDIRYDISKEQNDFKNKLISCVRDNQNKDIDSVKTLLKQREYI